MSFGVVKGFGIGVRLDEDVEMLGHGIFNCRSICMERCVCDLLY